MKNVMGKIINLWLWSYLLGFLFTITFTCLISVRDIWSAIASVIVYLVMVTIIYFAWKGISYGLGKLYNADSN